MSIDLSERKYSPRIDSMLLFWGTSYSIYKLKLLNKAQQTITNFLFSLYFHYFELLHLIQLIKKYSLNFPISIIVCLTLRISQILGTLRQIARQDQVPMRNAAQDLRESRGPWRRSGDEGAAAGG